VALSEGLKVTDLDSQQVRELQNVLLRAGYDPGPIDGAWGPKTQAAYTRFLRANGYDPRANTTVIKLISQLWSNEIPEMWEGVSFGGEVNASQPAPAPSPSPAPPQAATTAGAPTAAAPAPATATFNPASDGATEDDVRKNLPHLAYLLGNPEVRDVLMRATAGEWDEATLQGEIWKTNWWQTTSDVARLWEQKWEQDRATATLEWDQRAVTIGNLASQLGFKLNNEDVKWVAGRVLREGWSDEQLKRWLGELARQQGIGAGQITEEAAGIKQLAKNYMSTLNDQQAMEYAIRISEGTFTREGVESLFRDEAKGRFHWLAPQIDSGLSPMDLFGTTRNAVANMLEMDPNQIDLSDPKWSALTSPITENGQTRSMNFYEAQRWARQRPEWRFTNNANEESSQVGLDLLKALGVRA
jgi:hypothetical protein